MGAAAIRTQALGKRYRIGERERYFALRDALGRWARAPLQALRGEAGANEDYVWALKDVSLEVAEGEVVGIIGRNGAGKTTLLKILARVTRPTEGRAEVRGSVGSLLEVGTGFHPELTGRENVYLSGAILGMRRREIDRRFGEIVSFAGVERFIDTPLKRFSAGMQTRLAFAVAAHLEPDILLVDEVLAVGDLEFQRRCLGKMEEVGCGGRTVVFVSHQMNQIRRLCQRVIWLEAGGVVGDAPTAEVTASYERAVTSSDGACGLDREAGSRVKARFVGWEIAEPASPRCHILSYLGPTTVKFHLRSSATLSPCQHGIALHDAEGHVVWASARDRLWIFQGNTDFVYRFPMLPVRPGSYSWRVSLYDDTGLVDVWEAVPCMIVATEHHQHSLDQWSGILNLPHVFEQTPYGDPP